MTSAELIELVKVLKESGVHHFKNGDLELLFRNSPSTTRSVSPDVPIPLTINSSPSVFTPVSLKIPPKEVEQDPPHIVQQMKSLFKTSDQELIDQLFPLPVDEEVPA